MKLLIIIINMVGEGVSAIKHWYDNPLVIPGFSGLTTLAITVYQNWQTKKHLRKEIEKQDERLEKEFANQKEIQNRTFENQMKYIETETKKEILKIQTEIRIEKLTKAIDYINSIINNIKEFNDKVKRKDNKTLNQMREFLNIVSSFGGTVIMEVFYDYNRSLYNPSGIDKRMDSNYAVMSYLAVMFSLLKYEVTGVWFDPNKYATMYIIDLSEEYKKSLANNIDLIMKKHNMNFE